MGPGGPDSTLTTRGPDPGRGGGSGKAKVLKNKFANTSPPTAFCGDLKCEGDGFFCGGEEVADQFQLGNLNIPTGRQNLALSAKLFGRKGKNLS